MAWVQPAVALVIGEASRDRGRVHMAYSILTLAAAAAAQAAAPQATIQPAPAATIAPAAPQAVILAPAAGSALRAGTAVQLRMEEGLDSNDKTVREGNHFRMSVAENVMLGG